MEFTHYKARLSALCTGEVPTKDTASLEIHDAAKKALEECVVDSDGSGAKRKLEEKEAMDAAEKAKTRVKSAEELELQVVSGDLKAPSQKKSAPKFSNDAEAIEAFKQLLNDKKVPAKASWMEAMGFGIANDPRFKALKSLKKKKKALEDYATWKQQKEEDGAKERKAKQLEELKDLLKKYSKGENTPKITGRMRMSEVAEILEREKIYKEFTDKNERDDIIKTFIDDLYQEQKKSQARERRKLFKEATQALEELAEKKEVTVKHGWGEDISSFLKQSTDKRIKAIEPIDLPELWKSFVADYKERERRRRSELERERREKTKRATLDLYEWILAALRKGNMSVSLKGAELEKELQDQKDFKTLCEYNAKRKAEDEYKAAVRKVQREVEPCRKSLKKLMKKAGIKVLEEISWDMLLEKHGGILIEDKSGKSVPLKDRIEPLAQEFGLGTLKTALRVICADYIVRFNRKKTDFEDLLWDIIYKSEHVGMTWEMAKAKICNEEEYLALPNDEIRLQLFKEYMIKFNARKEQKRLAMKRKLDPGNGDGPAEDGEIMDDAEKQPEKRKRNEDEEEKQTSESNKAGKG